MIALGVDPGSGQTPGAIVCAEVTGTHLRVIRAVAWHRSGDGWVCRIAGYPTGIREEWTGGVLDLPRLAVEWARWTDVPDFAAVEGIFAVTGQTNGIVQLAEHAGAMVEAIHRAAPGMAIRRPLAREWRPHQLGIPANTPKARAEAIAIERAEQAGMVDPAWHAPRRGGYTLAEWGAVCEAAWIAREGVTWRHR